MALLYGAEKEEADLWAPNTVLPPSLALGGDAVTERMASTADQSRMGMGELWRAEMEQRHV